jgi:hypothetical protein
MHLLQCLQQNVVLPQIQGCELFGRNTLGINTTCGAFMHPTITYKANAYKLRRSPFCKTQYGCPILFAVSTKLSGETVLNSNKS